ncbi:MAG TPA: DUF2079 domain-containing protein [Sandaracinaceae bacterium LLY-WYZ-13_1]|nr:DUF2079 domain-containing protein [Sandaracinaceae bacterium LLY-WYZ-13_1]
MAERAQPRPATRHLVETLALAHAALFAVLGLARYRTFHNETFDLAFYTRIAWGLVHQDWWEPMVDAHFYGLHLSPVLAPLGLLGLVADTPVVLLVAQALALAAAAFPLARIGIRHLGPAGAVAGALAWLLYPNLAHVAGYEFHPGSLAALPLAWMAVGVDEGHGKAFALGALGALACREDLAPVVILAALVFGWQHARRRRLAAGVGAAALAYLLLFALWLHPAHAPDDGSLQLHFGRFGDSIGEVAVHLLTHPGALLAHLATPERLAYLPKVLAPLALLPLARPRWLLPAAPLLAINLVSDWPTTTDLDVHYLTPALPFLVAGALAGAGRLAPYTRRATPWLLAVPVLIGHVVAGGSPLSLDFEADAYRPDANTAAARAIVSAIPDDASVQAPYALLPHLAERKTLHRTSSPEANDDFYVLDVSHRRRFAGDEDLLRTVEEPPVRTWLAREDHALVRAAGDYLLLERGRAPRDGLGGHAIRGTDDDARAGTRLAACLALRAATLRGDVLELDFVARGPCPNDLAVRLGPEERAERVDLLFGGWLSPRHLRRGDLVRSRHHLGPDLRARILEERLRVGLLRQSGARPEHADPMSVTVPLLLAR